MPSTSTTSSLNTWAQFCVGSSAETRAREWTQHRGDECGHYICRGAPQSLSSSPSPSACHPHLQVGLIQESTIIHKEEVHNHEHDEQAAVQGGGGSTEGGDEGLDITRDILRPAHLLSSCSTVSAYTLPSPPAIAPPACLATHATPVAQAIHVSVAAKANRTMKKRSRNSSFLRAFIMPAILHCGGEVREAGNA